MHSTYRPIIAEYRNLTSIFRNRYMPYTVSIGSTVFDGSDYVDDNHVVYVGKSWCSDDGSEISTTIDITSIVRAYQFRLETSFDTNKQMWLPKQYTTQSGLTIKPVERWDDPRILNTFVYVDLGFPGSEWRYTFKTNAFEPTKEMLSYPHGTLPYYDTTPAFETLWHLQTSYMPEYPFVDTDKYWIGTDFAVSRDWVGGDLYLGDAALFGRYTMTLDNYGNFSIYPSLRAVFRETGSINRDTLHICHNRMKPVPYAHIDQSCIHDYYIGWMLPCGAWWSYGFDARRVTLNGEYEKKTITTLYSTEKAVNTVSRYTYDLTRTVRADLAAVLQTINMTEEVYLYDTQNDVGVWCIPQNTTYDWKSRGLSEFNVRLKCNEIYSRR